MSKEKPKFRTNFLDDMVGFFSPRAGFNRMQARRAIAMARAYEGAANSHRTDGWSTVGSSANSEIGPALHRVRDRVRDLVRNEPYSGKAVSVIESYVVGTGIVASIESASSNDKQKSNIRSLWNAWADSTDCDADGVNNFYGLQALAMRSVAEGGEAVILRKWRSMSELAGVKSSGYRIPVPFQIQVLEGDFIDTTKNMNLDAGAYIRHGVEFDKKNRRVAYWLWNQHPGDMGVIGGLRQNLMSNRVPAEDVIHLYRVDRAGQVRGMAWGASCVVRINDLDAYEDAQLLRQKIAAFFAGFVQDMETPVDQITAKQQFSDKINAGAIEILPPGKTITFPTLPVVSNDGHTERMLRSVAKGWGVTYELLTGDLSRVNFSSAKLGLNDFYRDVNKWQWLMFIPRFNNPIFSWFLQAADASLGSDVRGVSAKWTTPRQIMVDPTKEVPAKISEVRGGLQTLPEAIRETHGMDFEDFCLEAQKSNELLDKYGLIFDSDARKTMKAGALQVPPSEDDTSTEGTGDTKSGG